MPVAQADELRHPFKQLLILALPLHTCAAAGIVPARHTDFLAVVHGRAAGEKHLEGDCQPEPPALAPRLGKKARRVMRGQAVIQAQRRFLRVFHQQPLQTAVKLPRVNGPAREVIRHSVPKQIIHHRIELVVFIEHAGRVAPGFSQQQRLGIFRAQLPSQIPYAVRVQLVRHVQPPAVNARAANPVAHHG